MKKIEFDIMLKEAVKLYAMIEYSDKKLSQEEIDELMREATARVEAMPEAKEVDVGTKAVTF